MISGTVSRPELLAPLRAGGEEGLTIVSLDRAERLAALPASRLPRTLKILAESALRCAAPEKTADLAWLARKPRSGTIELFPGRLLLQDFTGLPLMTDLASLREALSERGADPRRVNPRIPVDFVVDHALIAEHGGRADARALNERFEVERNRERFEFLKWCAQAFDGIRVLPPGSGIMHQLNLEHLASVVAVRNTPQGPLATMDTLLGTDSHTTMVNGLGVLGWGVGGLEAEAAMLGYGTLLASPKVVALRLTGELPAGVYANDLLLSIAQRLRSVGVIDVLLDACGEAVEHMPVETRAMISNMAPEYGATSLLFPIDNRTLEYLRLTGRNEAHVARVEAYAKAQGLWGTVPDSELAEQYDAVIDFDLGKVSPCVAGPSRPDERVALADVPRSFNRAIGERRPLGAATAPAQRRDGDLVIAAITSCTSTSSPAGLITAGLLARNAVARGLSAQRWVKTSFAPGSRVVADYLAAAGLQEPLDRLGFHIIGYGCTTCNGNSGSLPPEIEAQLADGTFTGVAVHSGNRNFEGRTHPLVRAAYLASPALVIAYALAGSVLVDLTRDPLGFDASGASIMLADLWPSDAEVVRAMQLVTADRYTRLYAGGLDGHEGWQAIESVRGELFPWRGDSTFIARSPIGEPRRAADMPDELDGLRTLAILGDSVSTDHLSPNGEIRPGTPAARWLAERGVVATGLGTYAARRGHHELAVRGTFANAYLLNEMTNKPGPWTRVWPKGTVMPLVDAALEYASQGVGTVVIAGERYGAGSSRDWAAKGIAYLGVRAVIAGSFERIHRANLVAVGVLPLVLPSGVTRKTLGLTGEETFTLRGLREGLCPGAKVQAIIAHANGRRQTLELGVQLQTSRERDMLVAGGLLPTLLGDLLDEPPASAVA